MNTLNEIKLDAKTFFGPVGLSCIVLEPYLIKSLAQLVLNYVPSWVEWKKLKNEECHVDQDVFEQLMRNPVVDTFEKELNELATWVHRHSGLVYEKPTLSTYSGFQTLLLGTERFLKPGTAVYDFHFGWDRQVVLAPLCFSKTTKPESQKAYLQVDCTEFLVMPCYKRQVVIYSGDFFQSYKQGIDLPSFIDSKERKQKSTRKYIGDHLVIRFALYGDKRPVRECRKRKIKPIV